MRSNFVIPSFFCLLLGLAFAPAALIAQPDPGVIVLRNPSFEDIPRHSRPPVGWNDCGFVEQESPPDVHPDPLNQFQVGSSPQHGSTFLGMVVRDNDTWESVGQELNEPFVGGQCYDFRIQLARSRFYISRSRITAERENYVKPIKLRIFGGFDFCERLELLGETPLVGNYDWKEYAIKLTPAKDYTHIVFEAFYKTPSLVPYNGNLLLDNASTLVPMPCEADIPDGPREPNLIVVNDPGPDIYSVPPARPIPADPQPRTPVSPPAKDSIMLGVSKGVLEVDAVFQVPDITFKANEAELLPMSEKSLSEIIDFLTLNPYVIIEIGGHASRQASPDFASRVSLQRAESVVQFLRRRGVESQRMFPKGYGKSRPVCLEDTADCKRRNQRVEVRILKVE